MLLVQKNLSWTLMCLSYIYSGRNDNYSSIPLTEKTIKILLKPLRWYHDHIDSRIEKNIIFRKWDTDIRTHYEFFYLSFIFEIQGIFECLHSDRHIYDIIQIVLFWIMIPHNTGSLIESLDDTIENRLWSVCLREKKFFYPFFTEKKESIVSWERLRYNWDGDYFFLNTFHKSWNDLIAIL